MSTLPSARDLFINRTELCDYEGGYVDGKIVNLELFEASPARICG